MVDFDEFIVMREDFLKELNMSIDKVIEQKESMNLDYDLLEKTLGIMVRNIKSTDVTPISIVTPIKKEEMIKTTLDFFKSIGPEFHKEAIDTILQQTENIKMNIYNLHEVGNFEKIDETELLLHTPNGSVQNRNGKAIVNVPTKTELNPEEENVINEDECTLEDLFTIVHEIAHLFDLDLEKGKPDREELAGEVGKRKTRITRELLGEATTIAFEGLLSEYLLKNGVYSMEAVQEIMALRINSSLQDARLVYTKLLLAKEMDKNGEITLEFVEKIMRDNGLSTQYVRRMARNIVNDPRDMLFEKRYALGGLIAPTIIKRYKEEGAGTLKRYLEEAKNENFEGAMNAIGIELNEQGINQLIVNMKEQISRINMKER